MFVLDTRHCHHILHSQNFFNCTSVSIYGPQNFQSISDPKIIDMIIHAEHMYVGGNFSRIAHLELKYRLILQRNSKYITLMCQTYTFFLFSNAW